MLALLFSVAACAGVLSLIGNRAAIALARRLAFLDRPGTQSHKQQTRSVPYGGGVATFLALALAAGLGLAIGLDPGPGPDRGPLWPLAAGAAVLAALGLWDDLRPLRPGLKLAVQAAVAAVVVPLCDLEVDFLEARGLGWAAWAAAVLWCVLVSNAYNLLDHADGLSSTIGAIAAAVLFSACLASNDLHQAALWAGVICALGGFLWWNRPPARIYLGDAGSLPLGFLLGAGTLAVTFWPSDDPSSAPSALLAPLLITALPLYDTAVVMTKRWRAGRPLLRGDRNHMGHRLVRLGLSPQAALAVAAGLQTSLAGAALLLRRAGPAETWIILAQAGGILLAAMLLEAGRDDTV